MPRKVDRLLFVYNADSGTLNAIIDSAKKLLSINGCPLCSLTHSLAGERSEWMLCKESIGVPVDYVHRDELSPSLRGVIGSGEGADADPDPLLPGESGWLELFEVLRQLMQVLRRHLREALILVALS